VLIVLKSGSLNLLEPLGPVQACNGIALPFAPAWDSVVSLGYKELHLTQHGHPIQPVWKLKCSVVAYMLICADVRNKVVVELTCILDSF